MYVILFYIFFLGNVNILFFLNVMEGEFYMWNFIIVKILKVESLIKYKNKKSEEGIMLKVFIVDEIVLVICLVYDLKMFFLF